MVDHEVQVLGHGHAPEAHRPLLRLRRAVPGQQGDVGLVKSLTAVSTRPPQARVIDLQHAAAAEDAIGHRRGEG